MAHWKTVSKHLVHFSPVRTQPIHADEVEVRQLAADAFAVWDQFAATIGIALVPVAGRNHLYDSPPMAAAARIAQTPSRRHRMLQRLRLLAVKRHGDDSS